MFWLELWFCIDTKKHDEYNLYLKWVSLEKLKYYLVSYNNILLKVTKWKRDLEMHIIRI